MEVDNRTAPSRAAYWTGWILGILCSLMLLASAAAKFIQPTGMEESLEPIGWKIGQLTWLGTLEAAVAIIYLIPQTSVLGAILIAGYMGGAIATHLRIDDYMVLPQILIGVLVWLGLYLRDPRLRALLPLKS